MIFGERVGGRGLASRFNAANFTDDGENSHSNWLPAGAAHGRIMSERESETERTGDRKTGQMPHFVRRGRRLGGSKPTPFSFRPLM
ncbi:hypothetical protein APED_01530 [Acanthopleuribacter pedis]